MPRFPLDDDTAERLLSGELSPPDAPAGYARLAEVVRAAQAPAAPSELVMEASVVAAVAEAVRAVPGIRQAPSQRRSMLSKLASAKVAAIAAATVLGGTAAAAATGDLPGPAQSAVSSALSHVGVNVPNPNNDHGKGNGHAAGTAPGLLNNPNAEQGLCTAVVAHETAQSTTSTTNANQNKWMQSTAFKTLIANSGLTNPTLSDLAAWCQTKVLSTTTTTGAGDNGQNGSDHGKSGQHGKPSTAGTNDETNTTETTETTEGSDHSTSGASNGSVGQSTASTASGHSGR